MGCAKEPGLNRGAGKVQSARHVPLCKTVPGGLLHQVGQNEYDRSVLIRASFPRRPFAPPLRGGAHGSELRKPGY